MRTFWLDSPFISRNPKNYPSERGQYITKPKNAQRFEHSSLTILHTCVLFHQPKMPGNSAGDLFGMVKTWPLWTVKGPPTFGDKKGDFESPGFGGMSWSLNIRSRKPSSPPRLPSVFVSSPRPTRLYEPGSFEKIVFSETAPLDSQLGDSTHLQKNYQYLPWN